MGERRPNATEPSVPPTGVRYLVLAWLCAAATIAYIHRGILAVPARDIQSDLLISDPDMSKVMSSFLLGYAIFQLPGGWLGDRWGPRLALTAFCVLWSVATGCLGLATGFYVLVLAHFTNGVAQAGIFPCSIKSIARWFPSSHRALPSGLVAASQSIGGMLATAVPGFLLAYMSWRSIIPCLALLGLVWAIGFYQWFRNEPEEHAWVNEAELEIIREGAKAAEPASRPATPWLTLLTSRQMLFISAQQFFRAAGYIFYPTWFPRYLQETRGVSTADSAFLTVLPLLGVAVGATIGGAASDWIQRRTGSRRLSRQGWAIFNMLACATFILVAYFVKDTTQAVALIALGTLFSGMGGPPGYSITIDLGGKHVSTVFSLMNMAGNIGGALCPIAVTALVAAFSWELVLLLFVGIYTASAICWSLVNPTVPIVKE